MDEINKISKKQIKAKRVIYPTDTLLALKKSKLSENKRIKPKRK